MKELDLMNIANALDSTTTKKQLEVIALQLPQSFYESFVKISGAKLIEQLKATGQGEKNEDGEYVDTEGKRIKPRDFYGNIELLPVNHKRRILRAFKKGGISSVKAYLKSFIPYHKKMMKRYPELIRAKGELGMELKQTLLQNGKK